MQLNQLPGKFSVCRLEPKREIPDWAKGSDFLAFTVDDLESTVVCTEESVPEGIKAESGWVCFQVDGILEFSLTGIISSLTTILAEADISVYALSTFSSDYLMVGESNAKRAIDAWQEHGHVVTHINQEP